MDTLLCAALFACMATSAASSAPSGQSGGKAPRKAPATAVRELDSIVDQVEDAAVICNLFRESDIERLRADAMGLQQVAQTSGVERHPGCRSACKRDLTIGAGDAVPKDVMRKIEAVASRLDPQGSMRLHLMFTWPGTRGHQPFHRDAPGRANYWTLVVPLTRDTPEMGGTEISRTSRVSKGPAFRLGEFAGPGLGRQSGLFGQRVTLLPKEGKAEKKKKAESGTVTGFPEGMFAELRLPRSGRNEVRTRRFKYRGHRAVPWRFTACPEDPPRSGTRLAVYSDKDDSLHPGTYLGKGQVRYEKDGDLGELPPGRWLVLPEGATGRQAVAGTDDRVLQLSSGARYAQPMAARRLPTKVRRWDFRDGSELEPAEGRISEYLGMALFRGNVEHRGLGNFSETQTRLFLYAVVFRGEDPN